MKGLVRASWISLRFTIVFAIILGIVYPFVITGISQVLFHSQANGSLSMKGNTLIGSALIGQEFTAPQYFQGRPSDTNNDAGTAPQPYNAENSAGSNLGPNNDVLIADMQARIAAIRKENPTYKGAIPVDLVTADFPGFDPDISVAAALLQVNRVASARHIASSVVHQLVEKQVQGRVLGIFGEPSINVLSLNLALDNGNYPHK